MAKVTQLFLSAATSEFGEHRAHLAKQLHRPELTVAEQDQFINSGGSTLEKLDEYVRHCAAVIHLVGYATGSIPEVPAVTALKGRYPDLAEKLPELADVLDRPQPGLSYTQWEAWLALYHARPLYVYIAEDFDPPGRPRTVQRGADFKHSADEEAAQRAHLNRLCQRGKDRQPFANTQELSNAVLLHLADILAMAKADPAAQGRLFQLPARTLFVGRTQDLETLRAIPPAGGAIITGLKGMGGIGKTALARELAHEWKPRFPDAQLWLDGRGTAQEPTTPERLLEQVLLAFHPESKLPDNVEALSAHYRQVLTGKRVLVVLDNAHDAKQAKGLLPPEGCGLIVTSRVVVDLGVVGTIHRVGKLPDDDAAALLREQYSPLTDDEARELVRWCAGLPLALRLAGGWLRADAVDRDGGRADVAGYLRMLRGGRLATLDREAGDLDLLTIHETLALSERPLADEERTAWRKLGVFAGSFDGAAAREVAGVDDPLLARLVRRSLLEREGDRYRLHDLAAEYAVERLRETDTEFATRLAHARHYAAVGREANRLYKSGNAVGGLALFDRERGELEAAFRWLTGQQAPETDRVLIELVGSVVYTSDLRFHPRERIAWLEGERDAARRVGDRPAEGNALGNLGLAFAALGDARRAIESHEQALVISREIGDRRAEGQDLGNLGNAYVFLGDARRAIEFYEQALLIVREIGDRRGEGSVLGNLGIAYRYLGDARRAVEFHKEQLVIVREIGDRRGEGNALGNLGNSYAALGDARRAIEFHEQHLVIAREIGDRRGEGNALYNSGVELWKLGERDEALRRAEAALAIFVAIESPHAEMVRRNIATSRNA
jgi:tetratricopeptide (TPR) repeat protein